MSTAQSFSLTLGLDAKQKKLKKGRRFLVLLVLVYFLLMISTVAMVIAMIMVIPTATMYVIRSVVVDAFTGTDVPLELDLLELDLRPHRLLLLSCG